VHLKKGEIGYKVAHEIVHDYYVKKGVNNVESSVKTRISIMRQCILTGRLNIKNFSRDKAKSILSDLENKRAS
jgi:hypothetical protein